MSRRNGTPKPSASLYRFRDIDVMLAVRDFPNGVAASELADAIGLGDEGTQAAAVRLAWMRRFGMVAYDADRALWRLSAGGERVADAKLRAAVASQLDAMPAESLVEVMAHVTNRYRFGDALTAHMLRREFLFGTAAR